MGTFAAGSAIRMLPFALGQFQPMTPFSKIMVIVWQKNLK